MCGSSKVFAFYQGRDAGVCDLLIFFLFFLHFRLSRFIIATDTRVVDEIANIFELGIFLWQCIGILRNFCVFVEQ